MGDSTDPASNKSSSWLWLGMLAIALVSATGGYSLWRLTQEREAVAWQSLIQLPQPRVIADFALVDQDGRRFDLDKLQGQWSILFFGFTRCPDVCPSALYDLQQLDQKLTQSGKPLAPYQVIFVSVDPERDSPQQLKQYTAYFHPDFIGVTGDPEQLLPLTRQLGIAYRVEDHEIGEQAYQVDHSASMLLMNPDGRLEGVFPAPQSVDAMFNDLGRLLKQG